MHLEHTVKLVGRLWPITWSIGRLSLKFIEEQTVSNNLIDSISDSYISLKLSQQYWFYESFCWLFHFQSLSQNKVQHLKRTENNEKKNRFTVALFEQPYLFTFTNCFTKIFYWRAIVQLLIENGTEYFRKKLVYMPNIMTRKNRIHRTIEHIMIF